MDRFEMAQALRRKTQVTFEEAKAALERHDWDMLEAMIDLEAQGKVTRQEKEETPMEHTTKEDTGRPATEAFEKAGNVVSNLVDKGNRNWLEVRRSNRLLFRVPLTVAVLIAILCFWIVFPGMLIGYLFGLRYRFTGEAMEPRQEAAGSPEASSRA